MSLGPVSQGVLLTGFAGLRHGRGRVVSRTPGGVGGVFLSHGDLMTLGGQPCLIPSLSLQPFRCAHCHYSCNISGSLKRHYNRKHPNEEYANVGTGELAADALIQQGR